MKRAYVLAGGRSRRFGSDKARVLVAGTPLVLRLANDLHGLGWQVSIVAKSDSDYTDLGLNTIKDIHIDGGPLAGLITALSDCRSSGEQGALIANCDLVPGFWDWIGPIQQQSVERSASILVLTSDPFTPLPGWYAASVLDVASRLWKEGGRSLRDLHERLRGSIADLEWPTAKIPPTFNTPEELREILERGAHS
jgi:molybdopterin-guanine dinucleotide biosynthesis protein A